ncbi:ParE family toxin-like protein [Citrobacter freundii]
MALTAIRIPERVHLQAMQVLLRYREKRIYARRMRRTGYLSLKINPRWRLLSKDDGRNWEVMSHEKHSGEIKR